MHNQCYTYKKGSVFIGQEATHAMICIYLYKTCIYDLLTCYLLYIYNGLLYNRYTYINSYQLYAAIVTSYNDNIVL